MNVGELLQALEGVDPETEVFYKDPYGGVLMDLSRVKHETEEGPKVVILAEAEDSPLAT
jgi:hypothetical protein